MKRDADTIAREEGPAALAAALDQAEPVEAGHKPEREAGDAKRPTLRNWNNEKALDDKGEALIYPPDHKKAGEIIWHHAYRPPAEISGELIRNAGGWPRAVGRDNPALFVDRGGGDLLILANEKQLFAWINERMDVAWGGRTDYYGRTLLPKAEFLEHLRWQAERHAAIERFPHVPEREGHYYAWKPPAGYKPLGNALAGLLEFFDNAETPEDALLIKALFVATCWGSIEGKRPTFIISANKTGSGKSTLADLAGWLVGGCIDLELNRKGEEKIKTRLLSEGGLKKRILKIDNLKHIFSSELVEGLITAREISGDRHYQGEAERPNNLLWIFTANTPSVGKDIAHRSWFVRLKEIEYRPGWDEEVEAYIRRNRDKILADICALLTGKAAEIPAEVLKKERQTAFVTQVLARLTTDTELVLRAITQNNERRTDADDDLDEALEIMAAIERAIESPETTWPEYEDVKENGKACPIRVRFRAERLTRLLNNARNTDWSSRTVHDHIKKHIAAGRLRRVEMKRDSKGKGYNVELPVEALLKKIPHALTWEQLKAYGATLHDQVKALAKGGGGDAS